MTAAAEPLDWRCAEVPFAIDRGGSRKVPKRADRAQDTTRPGQLRLSVRAGVMLRTRNANSQRAVSPSLINGHLGAVGSHPQKG